MSYLLEKIFSLIDAVKEKIDELKQHKIDRITAIKIVLVGYIVIFAVIALIKWLVTQGMTV